MGTDDGEQLGPGPLVAGEPVMNVTTGEVRIATFINRARGVVVVSYADGPNGHREWPLLQVRRHKVHYADPRPVTMPGQQTLIDAVVSTAREPADEKAAAKQTPAALAEAQMATLPRCVRCGMLILGPQMATDGDGKPHHKVCLA